MFYTSTRDKSVRVSSAQAIASGISADGGLFVPEEIPQISLDEINALCDASYTSRAKKILSLFLDDYTEDELSLCVDAAYSADKFSSPEIAPLHMMGDKSAILELWRGPTCAFKDMALQILPQLLPVANAKCFKGIETVILVATSGDTGKAALEGFKDIAGVKILVFYPDNGVSPMQKLQMTTQQGENVGVCAIKGNFDDAQAGVKRIFTDPAIRAKLEKNSMMFSSANSMNWGRLVPQIIYYISAYCDLLSSGKIKLGEKINIVVPTGNFGNILAAFYAKSMGLPVNKLICASNANNVLTQFLSSGVYDRNRDFFTTISPSMDILISSNLERLLFILCGMDDKKVSSWMQELSSSGKYSVDKEMFEKISEIFDSSFCDDDQTKKTIKDVFDQYNYLCDTHTAVAVNSYNDYVKKTSDESVTVIASTASPYKFSASVLKAFEPENTLCDEFKMVERLEALTGVECPAQLKDLEKKTQRFNDICSVSDMEKAVFSMLKI